MTISHSLLCKESRPASTKCCAVDRSNPKRGAGDGTISAFGVKSDGSLDPKSGLSGLPTTAAELAAW